MTSSFAQMFGITRSAMHSDMIEMDSTATNLANINTPGYKASRMDFQELLVQNQLSGTQIVSTQLDMQQGAFKQTTSALNMALSGEGFFAVNQADGRIVYTRNGDFRLDANLQIVDSSGNRLVWSGTIPENAQNLEVSLKGEVFYDLDGIRRNAGTIDLYRFINPSGLDQIGDNYYRESAASGTVESGRAGQEGFGQTVDFTLEASNVNLSREFTRVITAQRSFQVAIRALTQADQMMSQAISLRQG